MDLPDVIHRAARHRAAIARYGLGLMLVGIGVHKYVAPSIWASYVAPQFYATGLPWTTLMQYSSIMEAGIGLGLLSGQYRRLFASLAVISILVVVVNLVLAWSFFDLILRDIGLLVLATVVFLDAVDEGQ